MSKTTAPASINIVTGRAGGTAADGFKYHETYADVKVGDFLSELLVTDTVVYTVSGTGRALNITYVDTGGLLQTEFNVMLPWSKEVLLPQPGETSASI